jgi:hypothetical protein
MIINPPGVSSAPMTRRLLLSLPAGSRVLVLSTEMVIPASEDARLDLWEEVKRQGKAGRNATVFSEPKASESMKVTIHLHIPRARDPAYSSAVNPLRRPSINPSQTPSINPASTSAINPARTASINPQRTASINPARTARFDPARTASINPMRTASLNPNRTASIDPRRARAISGFYAFDLTGAIMGFTVAANSQVLLCFTAECDWTAFLVSNGRGGYNQFDLGLKWTAFLVSNGTNGFNRFDTGLNWVGFLT